MSASGLWFLTCASGLRTGSQVPSAGWKEGLEGGCPVQALSSRGPWEATSGASMTRAGHLPRTPPLRAAEVWVFVSKVRQFSPFRFSGKKSVLASMG